MIDYYARFERYVENLSDENVLMLHRIVCRRAAAIYAPMFKAKRDANWQAGMHASQSLRRARRATPSRV